VTLSDPKVAVVSDYDILGVFLLQNWFQSAPSPLQSESQSSFSLSFSLLCWSFAIKSERTGSV